MSAENDLAEPPQRLARRWSIAICACLLLAFAAMAWSSVREKSPTADETYHALAGWLHRWKGEYRFDSEDPPLWNTLAAAIAGSKSLRVDPRGLNWSDLPLNTRAEFFWQIQTLFRTPGNDATDFIARFRSVMLSLAVAMGVFLAAFVWRLARACGAAPAAAGAAAVMATGLFAMDPNFLAHSPLMKNDVASAFALLGLAASTWAAGRRLSWCRIFALGICSGVALMIKFNAPLMIASSAMLLVIRALGPWPWSMALRPGTALPCVSRTIRLGAALGTMAAMGMTTFGIVWLSYGMRFTPASEPGTMMDLSPVIRACLNQQQVQQSEEPTPADQPNDPSVHQTAGITPILLQAAAWANRRHLLPQSLLGGLLYSLQSTQSRPTFLCGQISRAGRWWYFPFAMAVKTPLATLVALAGTGIIAARKWAARSDDAEASNRAQAPDLIWTLLCLALPVALYLGGAMASNLNLGLRHVLPVYPLLFAMVGLAIAELWKRRRAIALTGGVAVMTALTLETCLAYPNFIPFFNILCGGTRGGLALLSDSNLDWGQDLPLLANWQKQHPDQILYLAYFGSADPAYYHIHYVNLHTGYLLGPPMQSIARPGVVAISATTLQGPYCGKYWSSLWKLEPFEVLGGSIYLFHVPPTLADRLPAGQTLID